MFSFRRSDFVSEDQLGKDGKEGKTYVASVPEPLVSEVRDTQVAVKVFKTSKAVSRLNREAEFQRTCADIDVAPKIYDISESEKYIVMEKMESLAVDLYRGKALPDDFQYMLCALMGRMDDSLILHNDANALNVMVKSGRPYMIDFGMSKKITKNTIRKWGHHPNIAITLWGLTRSLKKYKISAEILQACQISDDPSEFIERGNKLLQQLPKQKRKRKRKRKR